MTSDQSIASKTARVVYVGAQIAALGLAVYLTVVRAWPAEPIINMQAAILGGRYSRWLTVIPLWMLFGIPVLIGGLVVERMTGLKFTSPPPEG